MTDHGRFQELAVAALDFAPSAADARELEAHLRECPDCRRYAGRLASDDALARAASRSNAPERVRDAVVAAAVAPGRPASAGWLIPAMGAAVVVVVLALAAAAVLPRLRNLGPAGNPSLTWTPLGAVPGTAGAEVFDVFGNGAQIVAVGDVADADGGSGNQRVTGAAWISADGATWQAMPSDPTFAGARILNVAGSGRTLLALGPPVWTPGESRPSVRAWVAMGERSCDSCTPPPSTANPWRASIVSSPTKGGVPLYAALAGGPQGFALVGTGMSDRDPNAPPIGAIVASSPDGAAWTFNDPTAPEFAGGEMHGVAIGTNATVAVGQLHLAPAVWLAPAGGAWTRLDGALQPATATVRAVAAGPSGFVAVGDEGGNGIAWTSDDGRTWTPLASPDLAGARILGVRRIGDAFVATGQTNDGAGAAWTSPDGRTWRALGVGGAFPGASIQGAAAIRSTYVLFGLDASDHTVAAAGQVPSAP